MKRNEIKFWLLLFLLNSLLFLPGYLFNASTSSFFPYHGFTEGSLYERFKYLFVRQNYDVFRISVDLFVLVFLYYLLKSRISAGLFGWIAGIYYAFMLYFLIYYTAFEKIFLIPPVIYNDLSMLKLGLFNSGGGSFLKSAGIILMLTAFSFGLILMVKRLIYYTYELKPGIYSKCIAGVVAVLLFFNTVKSGFTPELNQAFHEALVMIIDNGRSSAQAYSNLRNFNVDDMNGMLDLKQFKLAKKPDLYLIFIESYGKLLYQHVSCRKPYFDCLENCISRLNHNGWHAVSNFSVSPVSGGKSWISYTSVMFGYNVRNQGTYNSMLKNQDIIKYDHIFSVLRQKGYMTFRLNAIPHNPEIKVPWDTYSGFYSIDKWIQFTDMNYKGRLYGFGPSPPDQFSINFAVDYIRSTTHGPFALFFITQTTHNPFYAPDSMAEDWHMLQDETDHAESHASVFLKKPKEKDYVKAICYDLRVLSRFITEKADSNAIFILIGDHQPPLITGRQDGFETPVHIISRKHEFTDAFLQYGFQRGLQVSEGDNPIRHEGFYSMFMREFVRVYGQDFNSLPQYMPFGIKPAVP